MSEQRTDAAERSAHVSRGDHDGPKPLELRDGVIAPIADLRDRVAELEAEREALRAAHAENDRLLRLVAHDLQGRVDAGKLGAIMQCADRARAVLSGSAAP